MFEFNVNGWDVRLRMNEHGRWVVASITLPGEPGSPDHQPGRSGDKDFTTQGEAEWYARQLVEGNPHEFPVTLDAAE